MKLIAAFLFPLITMISCKTHDDKKSNYSVFKTEDFETTYELKGEMHDLPNAASTTRIRIVPEHNLLLLCDNNGGYLAKAYTLDSLKLFRYFVKPGEGPFEQFEASGLQYNREDRMVYVTDILKKKLFKYPIDSLLNKNTSGVSVNSVDMRTKHLNRPTILGDNRIVDFRFNTENGVLANLNFYDKNGELISPIGEFPSINKTYKPFELVTAFTGMINYFPDQSRFVVNYFYTDFIETYDTTGKLINRVHGPDAFDPDFVSVAKGKMTETNATKNTRLAYRKTASYNGDLYALYDGGFSSRNGYHTTKLLKFNKDLRPISFYELTIPIFDFDIDPKTGTLYGLTHEKEESIAVFKLM